MTKNEYRPWAHLSNTDLHELGTSYSERIGAAQTRMGDHSTPGDKVVINDLYHIIRTLEDEVLARSEASED